MVELFVVDTVRVWNPSKNEVRMNQALCSLPTGQVWRLVWTWKIRSNPHVIRRRHENIESGNLTIKEPIFTSGNIGSGCYIVCGAVCIGIREDTHVNILSSPKGSVLEMEHDRSSWTSWLELTRSGECLQSWPVALVPEYCWGCCSSLVPVQWGMLFGEAWWSRREDLADFHLSLHSADSCLLLVLTDCRL
jgi:hypothetical protein